ncbi:hypothetical protein Aph01nite_42260 [Acrocarpospora phusangensis]|uniref:Uncharacterized protein n=1 Tax=Acrocarpospora phusangensis TaxID=1070424 RepID=A0A919QBS2_9ACTN|nr:virulence factor SrfB [Acrocarpospora phusangensis]GIH25916.1 hypothetical protein Aph01nite_42260 [Acrocarpospora phusangensis]
MTVEIAFLNAEGVPITEWRVRADAESQTMPVPVVRFQGRGDVVLRRVRITAGAGAPARAAAFAERWTPSLPAEGMLLAEGSWWRLASAAPVSRSEVPPGRTVFEWTVSYQAAEGGGEREASSRITVDGGEEPRDRHDGWIALDFGTSTTSITMFDPKNRYNLHGLLPSQTAVIREGLGEVLDNQDPDAVLFGMRGAEWRRAMESVGIALSPTYSPGSDPLATVRATLDTDLYRLLIALERHAVDAWQPGLATGLRALYGAAFAIPPIEEHRMVRIPLHAEDEFTISSEIEMVTLDRPPSVRMAKEGYRLDRDAPELPAQVRYQPGLKQFIGAGRPLPGLPDDARARVTTDDAVAAAWQRLLQDRVAGHCQAHPDLYSTKPITHAVITYPTAAPPKTRLDCEAIARKIGLQQVVTAYDEATAAAMFYLMRDFAGDLPVGIEAFRARCRRDGGSPVWHRNILVVDIGGGTTDIALIGLTLRDETEFRPGKGHDVQGRFYTLRPTVRAKAGRAQLGGDAITREIFLRLKAQLADALLTRSPDLIQGEYLPYLSEGVYTAGSLLAPHPDPERESVRMDLIDEVIPTRWKRRPGDDRVLLRFRLLWDVADRAKLAQSAEEGDYPVRRVEELLQLDGKAADAVSEIGEVVLRRADLAEAIKRVATSAFDIGVNVVKKALSRNDDGTREPLDSVIISGGTSALPQIRRALLRSFTEAGDDLRWNPLNVVYDAKFAKTATSIGACWAEHVRAKGYPSAGSAMLSVGGGLTELHIDVNNLFHSLANTFVLDALSEQDRPLFLMGAEFDRIQTGAEIDGRLRSEWLDPQEAIMIYRQPFSPEETQKPMWASLNLDHLQKRQGDTGLSLTRWRQQVKVCFEIDERTFFTAHFCAGRGPIHLVDFAGAGATPDLVEPGEDGVPVVRHDIVVNPQTSGGMAAAGQVIFEKGARLTDLVRGDGGQPRPALISRPLPKDVPADGVWSFYYRRPGGPADITQIGKDLPAPDAGRLGPDHVAVLDERGRLTVLRAYVPYERAATMAEVVERPGAVLSVPMVPGDSDVDDRLNPFNGMH